MPRKPRKASRSGYYHFINRGVNKKKIFHQEEDFLFYKGLLGEYKDAFGVGIIHYCFMSNHTHLLVHSEDLACLGKFAHFVQRRYAYYYCKTYRWSEQVFRSRYMSIPIEKDAYLLDCGRYIERNPLEAGLVKDLRGYKHSSFCYYAYGEADLLISESPLYKELGRDPQERQGIYRFNVLHPRDYELERNKSLKSFIKKDTALTQPVPF